jgi:hypothetical protein
MRKLIAIAAIVVGLTGCTYSAYNTDKCRESVMLELDTSDVLPTKGQKFRFLARTKDGAVYIVETLSSDSTKVTSKAMIFPPLKQTTQF